MRIVLFSDIHGNSIALDAVLADIRGQGRVDEYWVLGDLVALGPDPVGVIDRLYRLPRVHLVRGNTDRYVIKGLRPKPTRQYLEANPEFVSLSPGIAESFSWTQGAITAAGWLEWLTKLPLEHRRSLPDGTLLLGVHASPGSDRGPGIHPALSEAELEAVCANCSADLVCVGHTHWPMEVQVGDVHVVNLGSVSNPVPPDLRASYVILDADVSGYAIEHHRVEYNYEAVIAAVERVRHPAADYVVRLMQGQHQPAWPIDQENFY